MGMDTTAAVRAFPGVLHAPRHPARRAHHVLPPAPPPRDGWPPNTRPSRLTSSAPRAHQFRARKTRDAAAKAARVTLGEYGRQWIAEHPCKPRTRREYENLFAGLIEPALGTVPLRELTPAMVRSWHAALVRRKTPTRSTTVAVLLRSICKTAHADGLITANPVGSTRLSRTAPQVEPKILTPAEVFKLADAVGEHYQGGYRALVLIAAFCGLRWGEVTALRRTDVAPDAETIRVAGAVGHHGGCRTDTPKGGKPRRVPVPEDIRPDLLAHLDAHVGPDAKALLFASPSQHGCGHLLDSTFHRGAWSPALTAVGLDGVRVHDLRHTAGTLNITAGATLKESMALLGHASVAASLTYQHTVAGREAEIVANLNRLIRQARKGIDAPSVDGPGA